MSSFTDKEKGYNGAVHFNISNVYYGAQANTAIKVAPNAGESLYITDIVISVAEVAGTIRMYSGLNGSVNTNDILSSMYFTTNQNFAMNFSTPIKVEVASSIVLYSTGVGIHTILVNGYTSLT